MDIKKKTLYLVEWVTFHRHDGENVIENGTIVKTWGEAAYEAMLSLYRSSLVRCSPNGDSTGLFVDEYSRTDYYYVEFDKDKWERAEIKTIEIEL